MKPARLVVVPLRHCCKKKACWGGWVGLELL
jgi:hypothetical protein